MLFRELMGSPQLLTIEVPAVDKRPPLRHGTLFLHQLYSLLRGCTFSTGEVGLDLLLARARDERVGGGVPGHARARSDLPSRLDHHAAASGVHVDADPGVATAVAHHLLAVDDGLGVREAADDVAAAGVGSQLEAGVNR